MSAEWQLIRQQLEVLADEFLRCSKTYRPLYHERFLAWKDGQHEKLTDEQWELFCEANPEPSDRDGVEWWCWNGPWEISEDEEMMGRFVGDEEGLDEFIVLAESACALAQDLDDNQPLGSGGYDGWLYLLHKTALLFPSLLLESEVLTWGEAHPAGMECGELWNQWHEINGIHIPKYPSVYRLTHNVFSSSAAMIRAILNPRMVMTWGDSIWGFPANVVWDSEDNQLKALSNCEAEEPKANTPNLWRKRGEVIEVRFNSRPETEPTLFKADYVGCEHITLLIERAGSAVNVREFSSGQKSKRNQPLASIMTTDEVNGTFQADDVDDVSHRPFGMGQTYDRVYDDDARTQIVEELNRLQDLIAGAKHNNDKVAERNARSELNQLRKQFDRDCDDLGRPRRLGTTHNEKARKAIRNAMTEQIDRLRSQRLDELANHFEDSIKWIAEISSFAYRPASTTEWETGKGRFSSNRSAQ